MKGLDKLLTVNVLKETLHAIIQNQAALQEFDVPGMLNYIATLAGEESDLTRFRRSAQAPVEGGGAPPPPQQGAV